MASLTRWNAKMLCLLLKVECGSVALVTTDLLSPNIYDLDLIGTVRLMFFLPSIINKPFIGILKSSGPEGTSVNNFDSFSIKDFMGK